jgi:predicted helicase
MDVVEKGVVGVITNHSWLDNPTFRGMRQSLMRSFEQIYVLDLHGNSKKKERAPDGSKDENVFDIEQGVAISVFVKHPSLKRGVWHGDLWGNRLHKYRATAEGDLKSITIEQIRPNTPHFLFAVEDADTRAKYNQYPSVRDIYVVSGTGMITKRDNLTVHFSPAEVWGVVEEFVRTPDQHLHEKFGLTDDVRDWKASWAKIDLVKSGPNRSLIQKITYRPFDDRYTYDTENSRGFLGWPVPRLMRHMKVMNIALITARTNKSPEPDHFFVSSLPTETKAGESTVQSYTFPLFLIGVSGDRKENFSPAFRAFVDARYDHHYTPEEIVGCIYAVLHAPTYRKDYAEFLRIDFPRIPFPEQAEEFEALSHLGWALVQAHLLRDLPRQHLGQYHGKGDHAVEAVRYSSEEQAVWINKTQCFKPIPQAVWDFHIGGYQVIDKYLKSRKGRVLSLDEINHVAAIADSLAFTIDQMAKIDTAYQQAFPDRG